MSVLTFDLLNRAAKSAHWEAVSTRCIGEGLSAWRAGREREANPYEKGTLARNSWDSGWLMGQAIGAEE